MKKFFSLLVFIGLLSSTAFATTYYTINDGNWSDLTSVWSTNGTTPCSCNPDFAFGTDTVVIRHSIVTSAHITINGGLLKINSGASLNDYGFKMNVQNGTLDIKGATVKVKELNIGVNGVVTLNSTTMFVQSRILDDGYFSANYSNVYINMGNIDVSSTGTFAICDGTKIYFITGNYNNSGSLHFVPTVVYI